MFHLDVSERLAVHHPCDAIGHGGSSKPSDGLRAHFPGYDYADMVEAQHRLLTEGLGVPHARLVLGNSMGGMEVWVWAEAHPGVFRHEIENLREVIRGLGPRCRAPRQ